jgi:hypothetical protein
MRRAHDPSGFRRGGLWLRRHPQQQTSDARGLRRQRQLATGNEIELTRFAPDLEHYDTDCVAGQRVGRRSQRTVHIRCTHRHKEARIETKFGQSAHRQHPRFDFGEILPHPNQRPLGGCPPREPRDKTRSRRTLAAGIGEHLVHRAQGKTAL